MNRPKILISAVASFILALLPHAQCFATHGALLSVDHPRYGPGSITRDTLYGLDWLDWSASVNRSVAEVATQFGPGGDFAGFRYATEAEVIQLIQHAGFVHLYAWPGQAVDYQAARTLANLLGVTEEVHTTTQDAYAAKAFMGPADQIMSAYNVQMLVAYYERNPRGLAGANGGFQNPVGFQDGPVATVGHVLVRAVPEPAAVMLCAIGGGCTVSLLRRRG